MKIHKKVLASVTVAISALVGATAANAAAFANGDFETCSGLGCSASSFGLLGPGQLADWTIGGSPSSAVDYVSSSYWQPDNGSASVALGSKNGGFISQTFTTIPGQKYVVQFFFSGAPNPIQNPNKVIAVSAGTAATVDYTYTDSNTSTSSMNWEGETYSFTADASGTTTLTFTNITLGDSTSSDIEDRKHGRLPFRLALDNVSVTAVPEPATWAMMILGFGFAGYSLRSARGKRAAAAA